MCALKCVCKKKKNWSYTYFQSYKMYVCFNFPMNTQQFHCLYTKMGHKNHIKQNDQEKTFLTLLLILLSRTVRKHIKITLGSTFKNQKLQ